jgi:aminoglycoside phosphotransferase (APT) family kinase protein
MADNESHLRDRLRSRQLVSNGPVRFIPLGGGVSSAVFLVENEGKRFVVKQALPLLKVKDRWPADISRNRVEYEFLRYLSALVPGSVPEAVAVGDDYFVMEYLGAEYRNWKELLLSGDCQMQHAVEAAKVLGTLHRVSFGDSELARRFDTTGNFHQLRTDPYLLTTGRRHPALEEHFEQEAVRLETTRECLVHGDYSPKNMLIGNGRLVLLDCEVGWYGDPSFDLAFLINHMLLKALYHSPRDLGLATMIAALIEAYFGERRMGEEGKGELDSRTARLLLMLLLARVDGKSPVEYLSPGHQRAFVREFVSSRLARPASSLNGVVSDWFAGLGIDPLKRCQ